MNAPISETSQKKKLLHTLRAYVFFFLESEKHFLLTTFYEIVNIIRVWVITFSPWLQTQNTVKCTFLQRAGSMILGI